MDAAGAARVRRLRCARRLLGRLIRYSLRDRLSIESRLRVGGRFHESAHRVDARLRVLPHSRLH